MMNYFRTSGRSRLHSDLGAEKEGQFDDQNNHHHGFEHEGAALVELVHHKAVKVFGGVQLLVDQVFVVGHADLGGGQFVQAGGKHVAEKFDGIVGALGQFVHIEQDGVQSAGAFRGAPAGGDAHRAVVHKVVD